MKEDKNIATFTVFENGTVEIWINENIRWEEDLNVENRANG